MYLSEYKREMNGRKKEGGMAINQEYLLYTPHLEKKRRQQGMDYMKVSFLTTVQKTRRSPLTNTCTIRVINFF